MESRQCCHQSSKSSSRRSRRPCLRGSRSSSSSSSRKREIGTSGLSRGSRSRRRSQARPRRLVGRLHLWSRLGCTRGQGRPQRIRSMSIWRQRRSSSSRRQRSRSSSRRRRKRSSGRSHKRLSRLARQPRQSPLIMDLLSRRRSLAAPPPQKKACSVGGKRVRNKKKRSQASRLPFPLFFRTPKSWSEYFQLKRLRQRCKDATLKRYKTRGLKVLDCMDVPLP
jgi:hypothetical protein